MSSSIIIDCAQLSLQTFCDPWLSTDVKQHQGSFIHGTYRNDSVINGLPITV